MITFNSKELHLDLKESMFSSNFIQGASPFHCKPMNFHSKLKLARFSHLRQEEISDFKGWRPGSFVSQSWHLRNKVWNHPYVSRKGKTLGSVRLPWKPRVAPQKKKHPLDRSHWIFHALGYFFTLPFLHTFPGSVTPTSALQTWLN